MNTTTLLTRLQNDPDSLPWSEKVAVASTLTEGLGWNDRLPAQTAAVLLT